MLQISLGADGPLPEVQEVTTSSSSEPLVPGVGVQVTTGEQVAVAGATLFVIHSMLRLPLAIVASVHGYKRNCDDGAAAALWGVLGFMFPIITNGTALVQGYGKPKGPGCATRSKSKK